MLCVISWHLHITTSSCIQQHSGATLYNKPFIGFWQPRKTGLDKHTEKSCIHKIHKITSLETIQSKQNKRVFLCQRDTSYGHVSVCVSFTSRCAVETSGRIELVFGMRRLPPTYPTYFARKGSSGTNKNTLASSAIARPGVLMTKPLTHLDQTSSYFGEVT